MARGTDATSSGTTEPGSSGTASTVSSERCVSGSKPRMVSITSSNSSTRNGMSAPIGYTSSSAPRTAKSPGSNTCGTLRSEEHTSELQSLMRISYAVFCLKKKKITTTYIYPTKTRPLTHTTPNTD